MQYYILILKFLPRVGKDYLCHEIKATRGLTVGVLISIEYIYFFWLNCHYSNGSDFKPCTTEVRKLNKKCLFHFQNYRRLI